MIGRRGFLTGVGTGTGALIVPGQVFGQTRARTTISTRAQARVYSQGLGEARILVDGERSGGAWWLGQFREDPGFMTSLHLHPLADEEFFVIEGVLSVYLDGSWHDLEAGTIAVIPRGTPHAQGNAGKQPVQFVGSGRPAGFERFFPELDELVSRIPPSDSRFAVEVSRILSRHDTQVLGPPPTRS